MKNEETVGRATRGNSNKLFVRRGRLDLRKYNFSLRTAQVWNSLPDSVISANSLNSFKNKLDKFRSDQAIKYNYRATLDINSTTRRRTNSQEESSIEDANQQPELEINAK